MATITVTNLNDSGAGSLRQAIADAGAQAGADTIDFDASLKGGNIRLTEQLVISNQDITITGDVDGDGDFDISLFGDDDNRIGNNANETRHLYIASSADVTLQSLQFAYGRAQGDIGTLASSIVNRGNLNIIDTLFRGNAAIADDRPDGIASGLSEGASATAILNTGTLRLQDSLLQGNVSIAGDGASNANGYDIGTDGGDAAIIINDGQFTLARAGSLDGLAYGGDGGDGSSGSGAGSGGDAVLGLLNREGGVIFDEVNPETNLSTAVAFNADSGRLIEGGKQGAGNQTFSSDGVSRGNFFITNGSSALFYNVSEPAHPSVLPVADTFTFPSDSIAVVQSFMGADVIRLEGGRVDLYAGSGNDRITIANGDDRTKAFGGSGNDSFTILGGQFGSQSFGETGNDSFVFDPAAAGAHLVKGGDGIDLLDLSALGASTIRLSIPSEFQQAVDATGSLNLAIDTIEIVSGGSSGDNFTADTAPIRFEGQGGDDTLIGGGANDTLIGGSGGDVIVGGGGNDLQRGGAGNDSFEHDAGTNIIDGGGDIDSVEFAGARSAFTFDAVEGGVKISGAGGVSSIANVENFIFTDQTLSAAQVQALIAPPPDPTPTPTPTQPPPQAPTGPTNSADNLTGTGAGDNINALGGDDTVTGLGGGDTLSGGGGKDVLIGNGGKDVLNGNGGKDNLQGGGGKDQLNGGGGKDTLNGGGGKDTLDGGGGKDVMLGGGGKDLILGGKGNDALAGGGGRDIFQFKTGDRKDTITDFRQRQDKIEITGGADEFVDLTISQAGDDVRIRFSNVQVTVENSETGDFTAADFIFSG